jgi:hypothetical protein
MNNVVQIGRCMGCDRRARLDDGVCEACLTRYGRRWAEMSHRCRTDPEFALAVYLHIKSERGRRLFLWAYGATLNKLNKETLNKLNKERSDV